MLDIKKYRSNEVVRNSGKVSCRLTSLFHDDPCFVTVLRCFNLINNSDPCHDICACASTRTSEMRQIVREGEPATDLYILAHGTVRVIKVWSLTCA